MDIAIFRRLCPELVCTETVYEVSTTPSRVVEADPDTLCLVFSLSGQSSITLGFDPKVVSLKGLILTYNPNPFTLTWRDHLNMVTREFYAVTDAGTNNLTVYRVKHL